MVQSALSGGRSSIDRRGFALAAAFALVATGSCRRIEEDEAQPIFIAERVDNPDELDDSKP